MLNNDSKIKERSAQSKPSGYVLCRGVLVFLGVCCLLLSLKFKGKIGYRHYFQMGWPNQWWLNCKSDGSFVFNPVQWSMVPGLLGLVLFIMSSWVSYFCPPLTPTSPTSELQFEPHKRSDISREKDFIEMSRHEDNLVNHRLTWLLASQGLFFAGYGISVNPLKSLLPPVGIAVSLFILLGIIGAAKAMKLMAEAVKRKHLGISSFTTWLGLLTALGLPTVLIAGWLALMQFGCWAIVISIGISTLLVIVIWFLPVKYQSYELRGR
jgi:hypothetical protein